MFNLYRSCLTVAVSVSGGAFRDVSAICMGKRKAVGVAWQLLLLDKPSRHIYDSCARAGGIIGVYCKRPVGQRARSRTSRILGLIFVASVGAE